jgi:acetyl-CoA carboxylase carboxyltransferase component
MGTNEAITLRALTDQMQITEKILLEGGGKAGQERQLRLGRLPVRERIRLLLDDGAEFFEINLWAAYKMYADVGEVPAAGVVTGVGPVQGRLCMIVANDATVKAGAFFPQTCKKVLRAQRVAFENGLPLIYLVDSAGAYLPMQDEIFPDEDDFGRIFRNNSVISAAGLPQFSAIMGNCIAGGAYLPVLSDKIIMTEGSGLYLAGPALVKAAIGQESDSEELGGATMHAEISGTADFHEPNDEAAIERLRRLVDMLPRDEPYNPEGTPEGDAKSFYEFVDAQGRKEFDVRDIIKCVIDSRTFDELKPDYGQTIVTGWAKIGGMPVGIVANQRKRCTSADGELQIGGVIYPDSADKAARFVMDCNQMQTPILFLQDVMGFMVGKQAEQAGIIRSGAKLVNALSNAVVPKITVITGGSFGAGNYAMCGKAYDPRLIFAWPNAKYAVMGAEQASGVIFDINKKAAEREGRKLQAQELEALRKSVYDKYTEKTDIRWGAARGWVDGIIAPHTTRDVLITALRIVRRPAPHGRYKTGVIQT